MPLKPSSMMSPSTQNPPSDLHTILKNIDMLLHQMRCTVNGVSEQLLAITVAVECITLTMKLRTTLQRWQVYLPFHECRDVDFAFWVDYLTSIHKDLNGQQMRPAGAAGPTYYPSHAFFLDLLEKEKPKPETADGDEGTGSLPLFALRYDETELQKDVMEYVSRSDEQISRLSILSEAREQEWQTNVNKRAMSILRNQYADHLHMVLRKDMSRHQVETEVLPKVRACLNAVVDQPDMIYCLDMAIDNLIDVMRQIDNLFATDKSSLQYMCLSLRLYHRHCPGIQAEATRKVRRWSTEWSSRWRKQRAIEKRDQLVAELRQRYGELRIADYIDIERPNPFADFEFGHFLFASRHDLEIDNVRNLFRSCFLIQQLNLLIDPAGAEADIAATQLGGRRREIYQKLNVLINQAKWQNGMTAQQVRHCFDHLLLKPTSTTPPPTGGSTAVGDVFWQLLTSRRNCGDGLRSLKLTWLNLVGYFREREYLSGGSLALCRHFFPEDTPEGKGNHADHNAVSKGARDQAGNDFHDLAQSLDAMLASDS